MQEIQQLSAHVVNKIAAGEVIERPASVVKELMENAMDAGATRIDVSLEQGGVQLIRVGDDGCGIPAGQLKLALSSHATSKIRQAEDLYHVSTLGFRGEALASIAEISRLTLQSRTKDSDAGYELEAVGGKLGEVAPCGCAVGTAVEVGNLFCNTPVRRKFLRTTQTEMGHCSEIFTRLALAFPEVHFTLRHNSRSIHEMPPMHDWRERIAGFYGEELAENLIWVESRENDVWLRGYVANPSQSRANTRMQYLLLNGRYIRDRSLQHALGEAYRGLLMTGRYPISFLRIDLPVDRVDVNVHPTKLEVRFQNADRLYGQLLSTLRTKFLTSDLTARLQPAAPTTQDAATQDPFTQNPASQNIDPDSEIDARQANLLRRELVDWAKGELQQMGVHVDSSWLDKPAGPAGDHQDDLDLKFAQLPQVPLELTELDQSWQPGIDFTTESTSEDREPPGLDEAFARLSEAAATGGSAVPFPQAIQVQNRYLITESEEGVVVIDQHALHERILYEQLREKVLSGALETQNLLVPETVDLSAAEAVAVIEHQELLARLGVKIEPFGGDTVLVSSYPAMLVNLRPTEVLRELAEKLLSGGKTPERRDLIDSMLHMISCKAAIKAGDRLTGEEIAALLQQRHLAQDSHHCPHGRPTALVFTREELDRQFKRT